MTDRKRDNPALMPIKILLVVHPSQVVKNLKSAMVPTMVMAKHNKVHMEDTVHCKKKKTQMINYLNFSAEKRMIDWL
jgi:cystathionine beta-lyase family protein involved in aluminum resistance